MKKIKIKLTESSLNQAIQQIDMYTQDLVARQNLFLRRLGAVGVQVVNERSVGQNFDTSFLVEAVGTGVLRGTLLVQGEELLFFEFGTGIRYNSKPSNHPMGAQLGMIIGEYGEGHGNQMTWYYKDDDGQWVRCKGQRAQMPVYMASVEILTRVERIAKEVFSV